MCRLEQALSKIETPFYMKSSLMQWLGTLTEMPKVPGKSQWYFFFFPDFISQTVLVKSPMN